MGALDARALAGYDLDTVLSDLTKWWKVLRPGGTMIVDDYFEQGWSWPEVHQAVHIFLQQVHFSNFESEPNKDAHKCRFQKLAANSDCDETSNTP